MTLATQDLVNNIRRTCKKNTSREKVGSLLDLICTDDDEAYKLFKKDKLEGLVQRHLTYIDIYLSKGLNLSVDQPGIGDKEGNPNIMLDFHAKARIHCASFSITEQDIFSRIIAEYGEIKVSGLLDPNGIRLGECLELFGQKKRQIGGPLGAVSDAVIVNAIEFRNRPFRKNPEKRSPLLSLLNFSFNILKWLALLAIIIFPIIMVNGSSTIQSIAIGDISAAAIFLAIMGYAFVDRALNTREYLINYMRSEDFFTHHNMDKFVLILAMVNVILAFSAAAFSDQYFQVSKILISFCIPILVFAYLQAYKKLDDLIDIATSIYMIGTFKRNGRETGVEKKRSS